MKPLMDELKIFFQPSDFVRVGLELCLNFSSHLHNSSKFREFLEKHKLLDVYITLFDSIPKENAPKSPVLDKKFILLASKECKESKDPLKEKAFLIVPLLLALSYVTFLSPLKEAKSKFIDITETLTRIFQIQYWTLDQDQDNADNHSVINLSEMSHVMNKLEKQKTFEGLPKASATVHLSDEINNAFFVTPRLRNNDQLAVWTSASNPQIPLFDPSHKEATKKAITLLQTFLFHP